MSQENNAVIVCFFIPLPSASLKIVLSSVLLPRHPLSKYSHEKMFLMFFIRI